MTSLIAADDDVERLLHFLYLLPVGLIRTDLDGAIFNMSPMANNILAMVSDGAPLMNAFAAFEPVLPGLRDRVEHWESTTALLENLDFQIPGDSDRTYNLALHRLAGTQLAFVINDITERVRQRQQILRREIQLRSIFETVYNHMIVLLDAKGHIQEFNASISRLSGFDQAVVGQSFACLFCNPSAVAEALLQAETHGWTEIAGDMAHRDGSHWWGDSVLSRIHDSNGATTGYSLVTRESTERRQQELQLRNAARRDPLTGLLNRRSFLPVLDNELQRAHRHNRPCALLMLDIDHFKQINDDHGHPAGDVVLRGIAERLENRIRGADTTARLGGEEFAILAPESSLNQALALAERCRAAIAASPFDAGDAGALSVTMSVGIAMSSSDLASSSALYQQADRALYQAKKAGRDRVEVA